MAWFTLSFNWFLLQNCHSVVLIDSFYCDLPQLIKLACIDTYELEFMVTANSGFISVGSFFILIISYIIIILTVQKQSSVGSSKALSTLSAHITVVVLFFGPLMFFYIWPFSSTHLGKFLAIFDAVLTPFLNPVIYTFRNHEMRVAMRRVCKQLVSYRRSLKWWSISSLYCEELLFCPLPSPEELLLINNAQCWWSHLERIFCLSLIWWHKDIESILSFT